MAKIVTVGSARIDERGKARGGKAGDQTGREVSTQAWYNRITNPWVVLRPKVAAHAEKIARCMEMACANQHIGYDQGGRDTLYNAAGAWGYDVSKVTKAVETDCSALVRVCCAYAGITVRNFRTYDEAAVLMATGLFEQHTEAAYIHSSAYLKRGDILVTKRQGHTVVVLNNGVKVVAPPPVVIPPVVTPPATDKVYKVTGIIPDVSQNQGAIADFEKFCAGTDFAIFRVIRSDGSVDTQALRNMSECQKRGYPFGVYIFFNAWTEETARALMRKLVTISAKYGPRCYMDDIEKWLPKAAVLAGIDELRKLGVPLVGSYMGEYRWRTRYRKMIEALVDIVWIANYGKNDGTVSKVPVVPHDLHQYTSVATVPGITDKTCDRNRLSGRKPLEWFTGRKYEAVSEK